MTLEETRATIKAEFMDRYDQWMKDRIELNDHDYGWKYGWQKTEKLMGLKDSLTAVVMFQQYIYPMRNADKLEKELGIDRKDIWRPASEKWLSEKQAKWNTFYYISQRVAKEIWKEAKGK